MASNKAYKSEWSKISDAKLVKIILDEHATCPPKISNCIKVLMIRLVQHADEKVLDLIQSSDPDTRKLGVQLLFQEYIYVYNTLIESPSNYYWELDVFSMYLELYIGDKSYNYIESPLKQLVNYFYQKITIFKSKVMKIKQHGISALLIFLILLVSCEKLPYYGSSITKENVYMKIDISEPDFYGGCKISITINNRTNRTIKKIKAETLIKNYYNEPLQDYITNQYYINFQLTGPIKPGIYEVNLIDKFYNSAAYYADITKYKIIFE